MLDIMCGVGRVCARVALWTGVIYSILAPAAVLSGIPVPPVPFINIRELAVKAQELVTKPAPLDLPSFFDVAGMVLRVFGSVTIALYILILFILTSLAGPIGLLAAPFLAFLQASVYVYWASQLFPKWVRCS